MSGIDEQRVPQCPSCERCHEFRVGNLTWMFPENARKKRQLRYSMYTRRRVSDEKREPVFSNIDVLCVECRKHFLNNESIYKELKVLFNRYVKHGEYYTDNGDFKADDRMSHGMKKGDIFERT